MRKRRSPLLGVGVALAVGAFGTVALGGGRPMRTYEDCQKLAGSDTDGERVWCVTCVARTDPPGRWLYDPAAPAGQRCRPDDGKR